MSARSDFDARFRAIADRHEKLIGRPNEQEEEPGSGVFERWRRPVLTAAHAPLHWRYDFDKQTNPRFLERLAVNAVFNAGAIKLDDRYILVARIEGADRKSFFAIAESETGVDRFRFRDFPLDIPEATVPATNVYDMRLTRHEDGWIYGLFCVERHDGRSPDAPSAATAQCGVARTRDLEAWERLADLRTGSSQQRNVVLHPEFVDGKYMLYTRPQDGFIDAGAGGGIAWGLSASMESAAVEEERVLDPRIYHTIKEAKNGQGPPPLKTREGWIHLAHGVRNTAAGLRYVLYLFVTELDRPWIVKYAPGGHFLAPEGEERIGDVSNVVFSNGWIADPDGRVFIYYGSSDTRVHVATTSIERLLDYARNTPSDGLTSSACVRQRIELARRNLDFLARGKGA